MRLSNWRLRRRLAKIGTSVDVQFMCYVNNEDPMVFPSQDSCFSFVKHYREENTIFKLQIYRIETFSL